MPDLTYFIGRPFVRLDMHDDSTWTIWLDGEGQIGNKDATLALPDENALKGSTFIRPIFSADDTRLQFGVLDTVNYEVTLNPMQYTMSDPALQSDVEIYPQVPEEIADSVPPDPSDD